jgi:hypothetical protein
MAKSTLGEFAQSLPHGNGCTVNADNSIHTGSYLNGVKSGIGKLTFYCNHNKDFVIEAEWASDAIEGDANMQSSDFSNYRGKINESLQMHGNGVLRYENGNVYTGSFLHGKLRHGQMT